MLPRLDLSRALRDQLIEHALEAYPQEACGFIVGRNLRASRVIALKNMASDSRHAFDVAPDELLRVFQELEAQNESLIAIYHSHPHNVAIPSEHDLKHSARHYPHIPQLIIGLRPSLDIKAWLAAQDQPVQIQIVIYDEDEVISRRLTTVQIIAVLLSIILSLVIFFTVSLALLPPAPPIPTPAR
ncbi:MAG: M67 family metallopeptidase [Anaerolineae bacterium]|nr:M67 family metallopeptidase [Anaerolineae bacterium]